MYKNEEITQIITHSLKSLSEAESKEWKKSVSFKLIETTENEDFFNKDFDINVLPVNFASGKPYGYKSSITYEIKNYGNIIGLFGFINLLNDSEKLKLLNKDFGYFGPSTVLQDGANAFVPELDYDEIKGWHISFICIDGFLSPTSRVKYLQYQ